MTDLIAVDLNNIENYQDQFLPDRDDLSKETLGIKPDILDLIKVYRHSDAKLKGFGACIRLKNAKINPEYMLLTGRGIKVCFTAFSFSQGSTSHSISNFTM